MRVLVVYAHPLEDSFAAVLHATAVQTLQESGHEVDDCDLYAEDFQPVLTRQERLDYHDPAINQQPVQQYVERLQQAEALLFCFPTWIFGPPAIMKGYFDRVLLPGVAFDLLPDGKVTGSLNNIRKIAAIVTYGGTHLRAILAGDPPRKLICRVMPAYTNFKASIRYFAQYDMNNMTEEKGNVFIARIRQAMQKF